MSQPPEDVTTTNATESTASERHGPFAARRRRLTLEVLASGADSTGLEELATEIELREGAIGTSREERIRRIRIALHHNHLPQMADMGVLEYDPESRRIESIGV